MTNEHITIQDIADSLGLSRNTVSKALNGKDVPARTRERVLHAAIELGYKSYRTIVSDNLPSPVSKRIVLVTSKLLMTINYFIHIIRGIESALIDHDNIELLQFTTTKSFFFDKLVDYLHVNRVDGIICIELFRADYVTKLIDLGYPIVFSDFPFEHSLTTGNYDIVLPESLGAVKQFCGTLIRERKCKTFGYIGDFKHCYSFYERFLGMREAMFLAGLDYDPAYSVTEKDTFPYGNPDALAKLLQDMPLPDCYIAANDTIAIALVQALKMIRKKVPRDVLVAGFDNLPEAKTNDPPLTTFSVDKGDLGKRLLFTLLDRIDSPRRRTQVIFVQSKVIFRQST